MSLLALFIALSVIGAPIKSPAVIGSVALDVFPALFASVLIGKRTGAVVSGLGYMRGHAIVVTDYAIKTINLAFNNDMDKVTEE